MMDALRHMIQKWGSIDCSYFKTYSSISSMKDGHLMNDSPTSIEHFYASIKIFLQAANKKNIDIIPKLSELSPMNTLRLPILPPPSYA